MDKDGKLFDKSGREIMIGDIIKVFHFIGARRKRHYMYKQVMKTRTFREGGQEYFILSHLNMKEPEERDGGYHEALDGRTLFDCEIVQSVDARFEDRPSILAKAKGQTHA